ncbi:MAG: PD-(D/E)XK nuclease family protein [Opitutaceae bacterium]|nr:PD-(D/E)XK nuclease family protein [Opitutaceae bacterium]
MSSAQVARYFLPWNRPWLPQVAAWLARGWSGGGALDLSEVLAVVPTRHSGRRLREALAEHAAGRGQAVFPPRVSTPDMLLQCAENGAPVASRLESLLTWADVLLRVDLETVREALPVDPPRRDFAWAWRLAEVFFRLQSQLNEAGLSLADVAARGDAVVPETSRWRDLAGLEELQASALMARGKCEPHAARREFSRQPALPAGVRRLVLLGMPDPLPLALRAIEAWAKVVPVEVVVLAPEEESQAFDQWGRPRPEVWARRPLLLPDFARCVQLRADPAAEAERVVAIARRYREPDGVLALGVADAEVGPLLENELPRAGLAAYNPEGRALRGERLHTLLTALAGLAREPAYHTVAALARCPDFLAAPGGDFSATRFLTELDALHARHLPADLAAVRAAVDGRASDLARGIALMEDLRVALASGPFPGGAVAALGIIFRGRSFDRAVPEEAFAADAAEAWRDVMSECASAAVAFPDVPDSDWWEIALRMFGDTRHTEEKPADALELQGWLELMWEDAPHLVVAGLNDGMVPEAIVGDAFLPETLRETLGLKTNAARFARDAYLLQALAATRSAGGRLDVLFAKTSASGEPLRPSRLLLRCDDAELPGRVEQLFRPADAPRPNVPWTRAWRLTPPRVAPLARVPVTGLRAWLACPFRFYLSHGLKMEPVDPEKTELDARDFGTLCHAALEAMARESSLANCTDEKTLREFLLDALDRHARRRFGADLALPLVVQLESARQRLARVADVQARSRAEGWIIEHVEWPFTLAIGGLEVRGKIDRIDRHEPTGARRVLDYKTSDKAVAPSQSHLRLARAEDETLPGWRRTGGAKQMRVWTDLQLPVYLRAVAATFTDSASLSCGYINLPKAAGETALAPWPELAGTLLESAAACTDGVAAAIRASEFWPPAELSGRAAELDPFAALFHHGAAASIAREALR